MLEVGTKAPGFTLQDQDGNEISPGDFQGNKVVLYFYPKDNTSGCTKQAYAFGASYGAFQEKGVTVIGVSKDSVASHGKFAAKYELPFPLISDPEHRLCEEVGVWQLKKMAGREYMGVVRTTFVLDEAGVITHVITKVNTKDAAGQLVTLLDL